LKKSCWPIIRDKIDKKIG